MLVEIYYDFYKEYSLLKMGNPETLKKYRLHDIAKFNLNSCINDYFFLKLNEKKLFNTINRVYKKKMADNIT